MTRTKIRPGDDADFAASAPHHFTSVFQETGKRGEWRREIKSCSVASTKGLEMKHVWRQVWLAAVVFIPSSASLSLYLPSFPFLSSFAAGVSSPSLSRLDGGGCDVRFPPLPSSPLLCVERRQRGREARWSGVESGAVSADGRTAGLLLVLGEDDEESLSLYPLSE